MGRYQSQSEAVFLLSWGGTWDEQLHLHLLGYLAISYVPGLSKALFN